MYVVVFKEKSVGAGVTVTSEGFFHLYDRYSHHALEYEVSGDGTLRVEVETSISGRNFISQGYAAKGLVKTSGPGGDGKGLVNLSLRPAEFVRFKATETGSSDSVTVTLYFVQK